MELGFVCAACGRFRQTGWKDVLEPLILFDRVLREDPAGAYPRMDFESRDLYRTELAKIAEHSDLTEMEVAATAIDAGPGGSNQGSTPTRVYRRVSGTWATTWSAMGARSRRKSWFSASAGPVDRVFLATASQ